MSSLEDKLNELGLPTKYARYRGLSQYRDMTEDDFLRAMQELYERNVLIENETKFQLEYEQKIQDFLDKLARDYDLSDMNENDRVALRHMAQLSLSIETLERKMSLALAAGELDVNQIQKLTNALDTMRNSLMKVQSELNISRKERLGGAKETVDKRFQDILRRAKKLYDLRTAKIFCPKCRMLLATVWVQDWNIDNTCTFTCPRPECKHQFTVSTKYLRTHGMKNVEDMVDM